MTNYCSDVGEPDVVILDGDGDESAVSMAQPAPPPSDPGSCSSSTCGGASQVSSLLSQPGPSRLSGVTPTQNLDTLLSLFSTRFTAKQIQALYRHSGDNFDDAIECLMSGPSAESILKMINARSM